LRAIWSGALSFGLVNIPVKLYSATEEKYLHFDLLRKTDLSPIKYMRIAEVDGKEVPFENTVKGYEYKKGQYVVLTDGDFEKADVKRTRTIEIVGFTKEDAVDPIFFEKPYYLEPEKTARKPYSLLVEAMKRSKKVGIAKVVLRNRERLGVLKTLENGLVFDQIRFGYEIRSIGQLDTPVARDIKEPELEIATTLIDKLTIDFDPQEFKDSYREALKSLIEEKAQGKEIQPRGEEPEMVEAENLMEKLRASLRKPQAVKK
jgi:DNA end-binding protein Ku